MSTDSEKFSMLMLHKSSENLKQMQSVDQQQASLSDNAMYGQWYNLDSVIPQPGWIVITFCRSGMEGDGSLGAPAVAVVYLKNDLTLSQVVPSIRDNPSHPYAESVHTDNIWWARIPLPPLRNSTMLLTGAY